MLYCIPVCVSACCRCMLYSYVVFCTVSLFLYVYALCVCCICTLYLNIVVLAVYPCFVGGLTCIRPRVCELGVGDSQLSPFRQDIYAMREVQKNPLLVPEDVWGGGSPYRTVQHQCPVQDHPGLSVNVFSLDVGRY